MNPGDLDANVNKGSDNDFEKYDPYKKKWTENE